MRRSATSQRSGKVTAAAALCTACTRSHWPCRQSCGTVAVACRISFREPALVAATRLLICHTVLQRRRNDAISVRAIRLGCFVICWCTSLGFSFALLAHVWKPSPERRFKRAHALSALHVCLLMVETRARDSSGHTYSSSIINTKWFSAQQKWLQKWLQKWFSAPAAPMYARELPVASRMLLNFGRVI